MAAIRVWMSKSTLFFSIAPRGSVPIRGAARRSVSPLDAVAGRPIRSLRSAANLNQGLGLPALLLFWFWILQSRDCCCLRIPCRKALSTKYPLLRLRVVSNARPASNAVVIGRCWSLLHLWSCSTIGAVRTCARCPCLSGFSRTMPARASGIVFVCCAGHAAGAGVCAEGLQTEASRADRILLGPLPSLRPIRG